VRFPAFGLQLPPVFAGAAMALSSVSVVTNALRIDYVKLRTRRTAAASAVVRTSALGAGKITEM
jgi:hypothetical protein